MYSDMVSYLENEEGNGCCGLRSRLFFQRQCGFGGLKLDKIVYLEFTPSKIT